MIIGLQVAKPPFLKLNLEHVIIQYTTAYRESHDYELFLYVDPQTSSFSTKDFKFSKINVFQHCQGILQAALNFLVP